MSGNQVVTPKTAWETCSSCRGSGLQDGMDGPVNCWECKGECMVRIRDSKGRYTVNDLLNSSPNTSKELPTDAPNPAGISKEGETSD